MGREVLSLKSIYKFLTLNDYPVYSEGIIKKDNRAGLTLTKFYLENILVELKNGKNGKNFGEQKVLEIVIFRRFVTEVIDCLCTGNMPKKLC